MTANQIYLEIISAPSGGVVTVDNRLNRQYVFSLINTSFAQAVRNVYGVTKRVSPFWYVPFYPEYTIDLQDGNGCFGKFSMPQYIEFDSAMSGLGFIGTLKFSQTFIPITSRTYFSDMQSDKTRMAGDSNYILIENNGGQVNVELYGQPVREFKMMLIPAVPSDIPTFNMELDEYPCDSGLVNEIKKIILGVDVQYIWKTKHDDTPNNLDETKPISR